MLVVEDDPDTQLMLSELLKRRGCEVVSVSDGAEALAAVAFSLKADPFDVAVVDVAMRNVDGLAFNKALRCFEANELYPQPIKVKYHTAYPESYVNVEKGKIAGEDYYMKGDGTLRLVADLEALMSCGEGRKSS